MKVKLKSKEELQKLDIPDVTYKFTDTYCFINEVSFEWNKWYEVNLENSSNIRNFYNFLEINNSSGNWTTTQFTTEKEYYNNHTNKEIDRIVNE